MTQTPLTQTPLTQTPLTQTPLTQTPLTQTPKARIRLTIDRLALPPMPFAERKALLAALEAELTRALADPATRTAWARNQRTPVLKLGVMPLQPGPAAARAFGIRLAGAVAKGLKP